MLSGPRLVGNSHRADPVASPDHSSADPMLPGDLQTTNQRIQPTQETGKMLTARHLDVLVPVIVDLTDPMDTEMDTRMYTMKRKSSVRTY